MKIEYRKATIDDIEPIIGLWEKLINGQTAEIKHCKEKVDLSGGHIQFQDVLTNENVGVYVAVADGEIKAFIEVWLKEKDFYFMIDDYAYVMHFYVDESVRKDKYIVVMITELYLRVKQWAKEKGRKYLVADTYSHNIRIRRVMKRVHFEEYSSRYLKEI